MTKHTELPWEFDQAINTIHKDGREICSLPYFKQSAANAQFIVKACNSHYEMLEFIKDLVNETDRMTDPDLREKTIYEAKELINKAESK